ncbi:MAG: zinc-dependent metalloprotease [Bdellovibrio sp.]
MTFSKNAFVTTALLSTLLVTGCTNSFKIDEILAKKQAPFDMGLSFTKAANLSEEESTACAKASCIKIQKASLGKIFLLIASGKTSGSTPQWYDLKPLVVSFERSGGRVAILGQNYNSIYEEIQTQNLIQSFNIISEDDSSIVFDWGKGLTTFVAQSSYDVDGARGENDDLTESSFSSIPVTDSFVRGIKFDTKNIELEQISKIQADNIKAASDKKLNIETREETLAMNVQIRAYDLAPTFKAKEFDASRKVGFFVTRVGKKNMSNDVSKLITKWDISEGRKIKVRISAAVPESYVQAVREGALYWNKVFGREVMDVEAGVDPQAAPQDHSIMIRWVTWLDAGAAYAIGQSDPLTGELLRAQVFMPSVFTKVGSADLVQLNGGAPVASNIGAIACDFSKTVKALANLSREASDSQRLRLAQDSVRSTVAHELGHALGLRHNFAGSSSAKVSTKDIYQAAKTYLKDLNHQGLETSTSIMDYVSGIDDVLMSSHLKYAPLSYDKMAMDWAYSDDNSALDENVSRYCTDDDIALANAQGMAVYGCERFDAGNNPLYRKYLDAKDEKENLVKVLFTSIIGRMYPGDKPEVVNNIDTVLADTQKWGRANLDSLSFIGDSMLSTSLNLGGNVVPAQAFASIDSVKTGAIAYSQMGDDESLTEMVKANVAEAGGYAAMINGLFPRDPETGKIITDWFARDVKKELRSQNSYLARGKTLAGREYVLTKEQQDKVLAFFDSITVKNQKVVIEAVLKMMPVLNEKKQLEDGRTVLINRILPEGFITDADAAVLGSLAKDLLTLEDSKAAPVLVGKKTFKARFLTGEERLSMTKLLSSTGMSFDMELAKAGLRNEILMGIQDAIREIDPTLDFEKLTDLQKSVLPMLLLQKGYDEGAKWLASEILTYHGLTVVNK